MTFKTQQQEKIARDCRESYGDILDKETIDKTIEYWNKRTAQIIDTTLQAVEDRIKDEGLSIHGACDCLAELEEILKDLRE